MLSPSGLASPNILGLRLSRGVMALVLAFWVKNRALSPRASSRLWRLAGKLAASFLRSPMERVRHMQSWHGLIGHRYSGAE